MRPFSPFKAAVLGFVLVAVSTPSPASANPGVTGYSGKPYNGTSQTCATNCHSGGAAPTLQITVPSAMKANESADVTIVVNGSQVRTSMNAAFTDGVKATAGTNTVIPFPAQTPDEVAAVVPPPPGASGTYRFSFVAPNKNGSITLWIAGMSASGAGPTGDGVATTTRTITVTGATPPPNDAGPPPGNGSTSSGGTEVGNNTDGGKTTDGGKNTDGGGSSASDDDDGASGGNTSASSSGSGSGSGGGRRLAGEDAGGCAASRTNAVDAAAMSGAALMGLVFVFVRRRKRR